MEAWFCEEETEVCEGVSDSSQLVLVSFEEELLIILKDYKLENYLGKLIFDFILLKLKK